MSLQDDILAAKDLPDPVAVPTPEWPAADGKVFVIRLTTAELAAMWSWYSEAAGENEPLAPFVATACAREADGRTPIFARERVKELAGKAGSVVGRIFAAADKLNLITAAAREGVRKN